ncbi:MAG TPA: POTRA domain-containing protein [Bryobacteraceae bacterium]|nr:POTRA domain-containing protein [Bryobacteraceae bacterium]
MALRFVILLACTLLAALAQTPKAWPIGKLAVEGNKFYADELILEVAGMKIGQMAGKAEFDAARDRLLATGAFESIGYKFDPIPGTKTNLGVFQIVEVAQLFPYRFEELPIDEKAFRSYLRTKEPLFAGDRLPATKPVLDKLAQEVQNFVKAKDSVLAKLEGVGDLTIVFRPSILPSVAEVTFKGNSVIPTPKLQQIVAGAAIGAVYTENRFRQVLEGSVKPAYETLGYLRVQFPKFEARPAKDVNGVAVTVEVQEGAIYKLADVQIKGELTDSKELLKVGGFQTGDVANFEKIRTGIDDIGKALRRKGYLEGKTTVEREIDDAKKTLTLVLNVDPGPQFKMGKLTIEGLDLETEPHIRKMFALKRGQPFNAEYPDYFLNRLAQDQILDQLGKTRSSIMPNPETTTVDVTLVLEGEKRKPEKPPVP